MSSLKFLDKECFEDLFGMASGYVLDFSNTTFATFLRDSTGLDIYAERYAFNGDSKARRLRAFWQIEEDQIVGKALGDLLEYWRYRYPQPDEKRQALYDRAKGVVERLTGRQVKDGTSQEEFLTRRFEGLSLKTLQIDSALLPILESRLAEAERCLKSNAPLAVIFHCGSLLEGLLLGVASAHAHRFNEAPNSPKDGAGKVRQFQHWTLANFIDAACELGLLGLDVKKFGHALREFRNYIHPYEQLSSRFNPDNHTAAICMQVLRAAIASLGGSRIQ